MILNVPYAVYKKMMEEENKMAFVECGNGHIYDSDQYPSCPYCNGGGNRVEFGAGGAGVGKTMPVGGGYANQGPAAEPVGATVAPRNYTPAKEDTGKTVAVFKKTMDIEPVVGWFVCIEGPEKGKDHRILAKNNTIGRSEQMDICIKGDTSISRENHARIGYDEKHNVFHLIPGESANNIYVNEEPVYVPTKLAQGDLIELGETKMVFVPFCREKYNWKCGFGTAGEQSQGD